MHIMTCVYMSCADYVEETPLQLRRSQLRTVAVWSTRFKLFVTEISGVFRALYEA